jgi:hypothetical protein
MGAQIWPASMTVHHHASKGAKMTLSFFMGSKKEEYPLNLSLSLSPHTLKKVTRYMRWGFNPE